MAQKKTATTTTAKMRVKQLRSGIGFGADQKATLRALGLGKIGRVREITDNPQTRGMVAKVAHLVIVEPTERAAPAGRPATPVAR